MYKKLLTATTTSCILKLSETITTTRKEIAMKHEPYQKVKGKIRELNMTYTDVADKLGLSHASLCDKINGKSDFLVSEAILVADILSTDIRIFLP